MRYLMIRHICLHHGFLIRWLHTVPNLLIDTFYDLFKAVAYIKMSTDVTKERKKIMRTSHRCANIIGKPYY